MGLILRQQMELIVAYIYKIHNFIKSVYGSVNLEFVYVFTRAINNELKFNFFYLTKINWNNVALR